MSIFDGIENVHSHKDKKQRVFYCFDGTCDHWRVHTIASKLTSLVAQKILSPRQWQLVLERGEEAIKQWSAKHLEGAVCMVVFIGAHTSQRSLVLEQIRQAWRMKKPMFGIYIHHCDDVAHKNTQKGINPFELVSINGIKLSDRITVYDPPCFNHDDVITYIQHYIDGWVTAAIMDRLYP